MARDASRGLTKTAMASPLGRPSALGSMWGARVAQPRWIRKEPTASAERPHGGPDRRRTSV
eukprot:6044041-Alexandrium_andersonii.AAC.1